MNVLISIKKPYSDKILAGKKRYEFRKTAPKESKSGTYYIFECGKDSRHAIIGCFVSFAHMRVLREDVPYFAAAGGVTEWDLIAYTPCVAIAIFQSVRFKEPVQLSEIGISRPPQSWQYLTPEQMTLLKSKIKKAIGQ